MSLDVKHQEYWPVSWFFTRPSTSNSINLTISRGTGPIQKQKQKTKERIRWTGSLSMLLMGRYPCNIIGEMSNVDEGAFWISLHKSLQYWPVSWFLARWSSLKFVSLEISDGIDPLFFFQMRCRTGSPSSIPREDMFNALCNNLEIFTCQLISPESKLLQIG